MLRFRGFGRSGNLTDLILLVVFLVLLYVFMSRKGYMGQVDNVIERNIGVDATNWDSGQQGPALHLVDSRLKKVPDTRPSGCPKSFNTDESVSLVLYFNDYQFYDLKIVVSSVILQTDLKLVKEIIVVDDGSGMKYIAKEAENLAKDLPLIKTIRNDQKIGLIPSRKRALEAAKASIVVFLDTNIVVNVGWLEPMIEYLSKHEKVIVVPHYDNIQDPVSYEYIKTDHGLTATFTWSLTSRMVNTKSNSETDPVDSAIIRSGVFAAKKDFLSSIGGLDEGLSETGSQGMELSFRTWLCGGKVKILPCSRVGVLNLHDPVKVFHSSDVRRITELWLENHKDMVYRTSDISAASGDDIKSAERRKKELSHLSCKSFDWYIKNVATNIQTPSSAALAYGVLRCKSGRCAHVGKDGRIDLEGCQPETYKEHDSNMLFQVDKEGYVMTMDGKCVHQNDSYVLVGNCVKGDTKHLWIYDGDLTLKNKWSNACAMHVTDPDKKFTGRQIMMAQECQFDVSENKQFIKWEFIAI